MVAALELLSLADAAPEKNKTAFYVCAGLLAVWAVFVSMALGIRMPEFPGRLGGQRGVMAISAVLVLATTSTAVITSGPRAQAKSSTPPASGSPAGGAASSAAGASTKLALSADPKGAFAYDTKRLSAKAGAVSVTLTNSSPLEHDVSIETSAGVVLGTTPKFAGGAKTLTLHLAPGTYKFFCSVPGHRQAGMEGTLTVS
jgi:plastocyanin